MQCNVGNTDRYLRMVVGAVLILLALLGVIGVWGWIGIVPLATGFFRYCPAYTLLGIGGNKTAK
ncbi:DUF2892 domain-containing protein [Polynucleobacter sp. IMCC30063]|uniref:YgaP family membrane protein n=1 Tax=unclassified Polynucleobacter TaxID=2640945 RepID=UPI001F2233D9|nr:MULTISPECIES: DUF2892 domain-containing protein [unclassified Polynucleobacter]MCE7506065.1 DUF2892 domain-containing protein [Polynucleobacter sp. IMCC30063]MCE7527229.1 DUF2892 domain-containing protein [Polynucleobacter sp. IMCC 30228]MCE7528914.1 DUF2892 domain-containing protein [Polynucleobacter sp. IMCC 29146]